MNKEDVARIKSIFYSMRSRCYSEKSVGYKNYGARGITICDEWMSENGIKHFVDWSLDNGYKPGYSIERIDVNKGYSPDNCTWIPMNEQSLNTTKTVFVNGVPFAKYVRGKTTIPYHIVYQRYKRGWSIEDCLNKPVKHKDNKMQPKYEVYKALAESHNLSNNKVSKDLKFPSSTLRDWRNGKYYPKLEKILKLADYFKVDFMKFFERGE